MKIHLNNEFSPDFHLLPNMNAGESFVKETALTYSAEPVRITAQMKRVAEYLKLHGEMTGDELQEFLHVKKTRAYVLAKEMRDRGIIEDRIGSTG
ncbi:MAG TPA: hypothetical protein IAB13_01210 [Candidatus Avanaerovorax faecigallinarum]|nr:hypothetical protein [Candidatus Avanaerovorax faecigallinarum]